MKYQVPDDVASAIAAAVPRAADVPDDAYSAAQIAWIDATLRNALRRELAALDAAERMDVIDQLAALPKARRDELEALIGRALPKGRRRADAPGGLSE